MPRLFEKQFLPELGPANMQTCAVTVAIIFLASNCLAAPAKQERVETDPELTAGYIQGDMVPRPDARNGLRDEIYRWPNKIIYYYINRNIGGLKV